MRKEKINIIIPPVWSGVYLNTARLLKYSLEGIGKNPAIMEAGEPQGDNLSIVLGWNLIPNEIVLQQPYIIYQLEPLVLPLWQEKLSKKRELFQKALSIWDYSEVNSEYMNSIGLTSEVIPIGYHSKLCEVKPNKFSDFDVLFVGFPTERRKTIIDELQQHCCVSIQSRWGRDFSDAISRSKILLNIHQYDVPTPLEQPRISYALNNHTLVVSESSLDNPYSQLVCCDYQDISTTVLTLLFNLPEQTRMKDIEFDSFKDIQMERIIRNTITQLEKGNRV